MLRDSSRQRTRAAVSVVEGCDAETTCDYDFSAHTSPERSLAGSADGANSASTHPSSHDHAPGGSGAAYDLQAGALLFEFGVPAGAAPPPPPAQPSASSADVSEAGGARRPVVQRLWGPALQNRAFFDAFGSGRSTPSSGVSSALVSPGSSQHGAGGGSSTYRALQPQFVAVEMRQAFEGLNCSLPKRGTRHEHVRRAASASSRANELSIGATWGGAAPPPSPSPLRASMTGTRSAALERLLQSAEQAGVGVKPQTPQPVDFHEALRNKPPPRLGACGSINHASRTTRRQAVDVLPAHLSRRPERDLSSGDPNVATPDHPDASSLIAPDGCKVGTEPTAFSDPFALVGASITGMLAGGSSVPSAVPSAGLRLRSAPPATPAESPEAAADVELTLQGSSPSQTCVNYIAAMKRASTRSSADASAPARERTDDVDQVAGEQRSEREHDSASPLGFYQRGLRASATRRVSQEPERAGRPPATSPSALADVSHLLGTSDSTSSSDTAESRPSSWRNLSIQAQVAQALAAAGASWGEFSRRHTRSSTGSSSKSTLSIRTHSASDLASPFVDGPQPGGAQDAAGGRVDARVDSGDSRSAPGGRPAAHRVTTSLPGTHARAKPAAKARGGAVSKALRALDPGSDVSIGTYSGGASGTCWRERIPADALSGRVSADSQRSSRFDRASGHSATVPVNAVCGGETPLESAPHSVPACPQSGQRLQREPFASDGLHSGAAAREALCAQSSSDRLTSDAADTLFSKETQPAVQEVDTRVAGWLQLAHLESTVSASWHSNDLNHLPAVDESATATTFSRKLSSSTQSLSQRLAVPSRRSSSSLSRAVSRNTATAAFNNKIVEALRTRPPDKRDGAAVPLKIGQRFRKAPRQPPVQAAGTPCVASRGTLRS